MGNNELKMFIQKYLDKKIKENENFIRFTYYEIRVKSNLNEEEANKFINLCSIYLRNNGYSVYFTDEKYMYENANRTVQINELLIAIKQK